MIETWNIALLGSGSDNARILVTADAPDVMASLTSLPIKKDPNKPERTRRVREIGRRIPLKLLDDDKVTKPIRHWRLSSMAETVHGSELERLSSFNSVCFTFKRPRASKCPELSAFSAWLNKHESDLIEWLKLDQEKIKAARTALAEAKVGDLVKELAEDASKQALSVIEQDVGSLGYFQDRLRELRELKEKLDGELVSACVERAKLWAQNDLAALNDYLRGRSADPSLSQEVLGLPEETTDSFVMRLSETVKAKLIVDFADEGSLRSVLRERIEERGVTL